MPTPIVFMAADGQTIITLREQLGLSVKDLQRILRSAAPQAADKEQLGLAMTSPDRRVRQRTQVNDNNMEYETVTTAADPGSDCDLEIEEFIREIKEICDEFEREIENERLARSEVQIIEKKDDNLSEFISKTT